MSFPRYPAYKPSGVEWLGEVPEHWEMGQSRRRFRLRNEPTKEADEQLTASQKHGIIRQAEFIESEGRRVVEVIKGQDILKHVEPAVPIRKVVRSGCLNCAPLSSLHQFVP
jgi:type I restriction enzyme S subunit